MVQFKAAYLSLGGRSLAGGSSLPLGPWITCFNIRHAYPAFIIEGKISNMNNLNVSFLFM